MSCTLISYIKPSLIWPCDPKISLSLRNSLSMSHTQIRETPILFTTPTYSLVSVQSGKVSTVGGVLKGSSPLEVHCKGSSGAFMTLVLELECGYSLLTM